MQSEIWVGSKDGGGMQVARPEVRGDHVLFLDDSLIQVCGDVVELPCVATFFVVAVRFGRRASSLS